MNFSDISPGKPVQDDTPDRKTVAERANQAKKKRLSALETSLKRGRCIVFLSGNGTLTSSFPSRLIGTVNRIMKDSTLEQREKQQKLRDEAFSGNEEAALDVLANYSDQEWKPSKR